MQPGGNTIKSLAAANKAEDPKQRALHVTVLGAGAVGLSWTGLFLANGLRVTVYDPQPDIKLAVLSGLETIKWSLEDLGYRIEKFTRHLYFSDKLHTAVANADIIQECVSEDVEAKQSLYEKLDRFSRSSTLILSSSATLCASLITKHMRDAHRVMIGHSFDVPHLIPLVEVVPCSKTSEEYIDRAMNFYRSIGKWPVLIGKEVAGFVVNRLHFALLREGIYLVITGVISMQDLDQLVQASLGLRWAAAGPFKTLALSGGAEGIAHFLDHTGQMENIWRGLGHVILDPPTQARLRKQLADCYARVPVEDLIKARDEEQIAILKVLRKHS